MTKHNATINTALPLMEEYANQTGLTLAEIMRRAGKISQSRKPDPYKAHRVAINSRGELFLIPPKLQGAFE